MTVLFHRLSGVGRRERLPSEKLEDRDGCLHPTLWFSHRYRAADRRCVGVSTAASVSTCQILRFVTLERVGDMAASSILQQCPREIEMSMGQSERLTLTQAAWKMAIRQCLVTGRGISLSYSSPRKCSHRS
ncbi:uncharacterized protein K489DRAFT_375164 [Dissoconium aciculare CBS 342.82]|uniref:Uncharacterized protein n=1 Tax=Dissoconium aciculare CBS 342.82 TaxID=1314786 RepID=A0A6J3MJG8_9PEZI|nr:uncharacterized protein K489DRAFT_375164 [Dissoconium aciculare CBS 342.82]KAF1827077.1 hypothetical protein K489DRAFT_375164 [Dissoconium aciculare CBS 342.82]